MNKHRTCRIISILAVVIGSILISGGLWADVLNPLVVDQTGEYRTDGIFRWLSPLLLHLWILDAGLPYGILSLIGGIIGLTVTLPPSCGRSAFRDTHRLGLAALAVEAFTHALIFVCSVDFFFVDAGSSIRPMGWAALVGVIAIITFLAALPLSILAILKERPRFVGAVALIFSLTPNFFAWGILYLAIAVKGFELAD